MEQPYSGFFFIFCDIRIWVRAISGTIGALKKKSGFACYQKRDILHVGMWSQSRVHNPSIRNRAVCSYCPVWYGTLLTAVRSVPAVRAARGTVKPSSASVPIRKGR